MVTKKELVEGIKMLNEAGIGIKIKTVGIKEADLKESFMATIDEILDAGKQKSIPEKVALLYNTLVEEEEEKDENKIEEDEKTVSKKETYQKSEKAQPASEKIEKEKFSKKPGTTRVTELVCSNPKISKEEILKTLVQEGITINEGTINIQMRDAMKVIIALIKLGKLSEDFMEQR